MKAIRSNIKGTSYGGIIPILKKIQEAGIPRLIRKSLGHRVTQAKYAYHDVFISWTLGALCGCKRIEQISRMRKKFSIIPGLNLPSHDTIGRVMKKLATEIKISRGFTTNLKGKENFTYHSEHFPLNEALVKSSKAIGALREGISYTMDIDATFIETLRRGAMRHFDENNKLTKTNIGFSPFVCQINDMPVYISMRNGNAGAMFQILESTTTCLNLLDKSKIKIGRIISDAAGYNKELMRMLDKRGIKFNIRFSYKKNMKTFNSELHTCTNWRKTEIETANYFWDCEIADFKHEMFQHYTDLEHAGTYRIVAIRIPTEETRLRQNSADEIERRKMIKEKLKNLQNKKVLKEIGKPFEDANWKEIDGYLYKFFITNDFKTLSEGIVKEYNKRGDAERKFHFMKEDFAWKRPPFMEMNENLVFLIAAALANNIFRGIMRLFKEKIPGLELSNRIDKFKSLFIEVACAFIKDKFVFFSQDILYDELMN